MAKTIATIRYQSKPGAEIFFLALINSEDFKKTLLGYAGFISYNLVKLDSDTWCEYILWESVEAATSGANTHQKAPVNLALLPYLIVTSFETAFLETTIAF